VPPIEVAIYITSAELAQQVTAELAAAGHTVTPWQPGAPLAAGVRALLVDGLDAAMDAFDVACDLVALVEPAEVALFPEFPRELTDFVLKPLRPGEVVARMAHVSALEPLAIRERQRVLALAVDAASDIIELGDPNTVLQYVNRAYEQALGDTFAEAVGKTPAPPVRTTTA